MAGISSKNAGTIENKKKYNSYDYNSDFDINVYESFYRTHDPQIGRFLQIDPKPNDLESPYVAMGSNPILNFDALGDTTVPGAGFLANVGYGIADGWESTKGFVKSLGTVEGWKNLSESFPNSPMTPEKLLSTAQKGESIINGVKNIPNMTKDDWGHAIGFGLEKTIETVVATKGVGAVKNVLKGSNAVSGIANVVPEQVSRVIPNFGGEVSTLGRTGAKDVFVTASSDIKGMSASQIAKKLTIPESSTGYKVITFETPQGIASPINRTNPGFIGKGRTAGGAREYVVPNQAVPTNATIKIVN